MTMILAILKLFRVLARHTSGLKLEDFAHEHARARERILALNSIDLDQVAP